MEVKDLQQYEIIINKHIEEVNSNAYLLKHKKQVQELLSYQTMMTIKFLILVLEHR